MSSYQGILSPHDAIDAVRAGADGLIVSNHGGRALDGALSSIESLGPVVEVRCSIRLLRRAYSVLGLMCSRVQSLRVELW